MTIWKYGKLVRAAREAKDLSQTQVAQALKMSQPWVSQLEKGNTQADIKQALILERLLGVDVGELFADILTDDDIGLEREIVRSGMSLEEQTIALQLCGHFLKRDMLKNAEYLRMGGDLPREA